MRYRTIVADPPWEQPSGGMTTSKVWTPNRPGNLPYETMPLAAICALPVARLAERDAHLYLWTTNAHIESAYTVARAWNFNPSRLLTWCKAPRGIGLGGTFSTTTEFVLFCRRGSLKSLAKVDSTWWHWKRPHDGSKDAHSAKPEAFLDLVEQVSPGPRLELFARRQRLGWDTWGNEALEHVEIPA